MSFEKKMNESFKMNTNSIYKLSKAEKIAIEEALEESEKGNFYSHGDVMKEAKLRYPNLKFELKVLY